MAHHLSQIQPRSLNLLRGLIRTICTSPLAGIEVVTTQQEALEQQKQIVIALQVVT